MLLVSRSQVGSNLKQRQARLGTTLQILGGLALLAVGGEEVIHGGFPGISIGDVFGSNIANVLLLIVLVALTRPMTVARAAIGRDLLIAFGVSAGRSQRRNAEAKRERDAPAHHLATAESPACTRLA